MFILLWKSSTSQRASVHRKLPPLAAPASVRPPMAAKSLAQGALQERRGVGQGPWVLGEWMASLLEWWEWDLGVAGWNFIA